MTKPEPVPSSPLTLIMTTLGRTRAAMPATESGGRLASAGGTVPRLYVGFVLDADREPIYPPTSPPASADTTAVIRATTSRRRPDSRPDRHGSGSGDSGSSPAETPGGRYIGDGQLRSSQYDK